MNDLLRDAIADARAVRETAMQNARVALEEAFAPRLQSMLSAKISEELDEEEPDMEEFLDPEDQEATSFLNRRDRMAEADDEFEGDDMPPAEDEMDDMPPASGKGEPEGEIEIEIPEPDMEGDDMPPAEGEEDDLELEQILRELEALDDTDDMGAEYDDEADLEEAAKSSGIGTGDNKKSQADKAHTDDPGKGKLTESEDADEDDKEGDKDELEEAYRVINYLRSKINEVNMLNAKLLYSNKLFRNYELNEDQKVKVIENFDRTNSIREVKLLYSALAESFGMTRKSNKKTIRESAASRPSRSTAPRKEVLNEGKELAARWSKLVNYRG